MILLLAKINPIEEVVSKELFRFGSFVFTNHMFMVTAATVVLLISFPLAVGKIQILRKGFGNLIESICVFLRNEVVRPFLKDETDKYMPFLWTLFFFILTINLLGLIPFDRIFYAVTGKQNHFGGAATANIWVTGALATFSFFLFHIAGIVENGFVSYIKNFSPKVPWPMMPFMFGMELVSSFVRLFSLAIRLFANMLAGHVLIATILSFILIYKNYFVATAVIPFSVVMDFMEIFVAFLQAYIFVYLTTIFIGFAIHPEH